MQSQRPLDTIETSESKATLADDVVTTVAAGAGVGVGMIPVCLATKKAQLTEAASPGKTLPTKQCVLASTKPKNLGLVAAQTILASSKIGARKNTVIGQRNNIGETINGEPANISTESYDSITSSVKTATVVAGLDALVMNPSGNRQTWMFAKLLKPDTFTAPEPTTSAQKWNARTTGSTLRLMKGLPPIAGLVAQPLLKPMLPDTLSDEQKDITLALGIGLAIGIPTTALDNFHNKQLDTVDRITCKTQSITHLLKTQGLSVFKIGGRTAACGIVSQVALQYLVPLATEAAENYVTPTMMSTATLIHDEFMRQEEARSPRGPRR